MTETPRDRDPAGPEVLPDSGMDTGSDEGTPGERPAVPPEDALSRAAADDAPLPAADAGAESDGEADDGLDPQFSER